MSSPNSLRKYGWSLCTTHGPALLLVQTVLSIHGCKASNPRRNIPLPALVAPHSDGDGVVLPLIAERSAHLHGGEAETLPDGGEFRAGHGSDVAVADFASRLEAVATIDVMAVNRDADVSLCGRIAAIGHLVKGAFIAA